MRHGVLVALLLVFPSIITAADPRDPHRRASAELASTGPLVPIQSLREQCIEFSDIKPGKRDVDFRDCRVSDFGSVGTIGTQTYYYAVYCIIPNDSLRNEDCSGDSFNARYYRARGLAIFVQQTSSKDARLLLERADMDIGLFVYDKKPEIIHNAVGTILYVPIVVDGTGHGNASEYYLWEDARWQRIESEEWLADLRRRIAPRFEIWKGVWPDIHRMEAEALLYRKGDANCCPTGGTARVMLTVRDMHFVIRSIAIKAGQ